MKQASQNTKTPTELLSAAQVRQKLGEYRQQEADEIINRLRVSVGGSPELNRVLPDGGGEWCSGIYTKHDLYAPMRVDYLITAYYYTDDEHEEDRELADLNGEDFRYHGPKEPAGYTVTRGRFGFNGIA